VLGFRNYKIPLARDSNSRYEIRLIAWYEV
jgi:hypothetical protein